MTTAPQPLNPSDHEPELSGHEPPEHEPAPPGHEPEVIDARGLRCPLPVIRLAARAKALPPGTELVVLTTDPAARPDIAAWCRMRNHDLLSQTHFGDDALRHQVRLN